MIRISLVSILFSCVIHLFRFGYSIHLWFFLLFTGLLLLLLVYGDDFGFFEGSTGWFKGGLFMLIDEGQTILGVCFDGMFQSRLFNCAEFITIEDPYVGLEGREIF